MQKHIRQETGRHLLHNKRRWPTDVCACRIQSVQVSIPSMCYSLPPPSIARTRNFTPAVTAAALVTGAGPISFCSCSTNCWMTSWSDRVRCLRYCFSSSVAFLTTIFCRSSCCCCCCCWSWWCRWFCCFCARSSSCCCCGWCFCSRYRL